MCVRTSHWPYGIHFLCCVHGNEHTRTHDVVCDTFVAIAWNVSFHVGQKQLHASPSTMFKSTCWLVNIMSTKDENFTLADVVITNPTWSIFIFFDFAQFKDLVTFDVAQAKEKSYRNHHQVDQLLLLAIEIFGCLHKQVDVEKHDCVDPIWSLKEPKGPPLSILVIFLHQKISKGCKDTSF
jgi:hypothetical protein